MKMPPPCLLFTLVSAVLLAGCVSSAQRQAWQEINAEHDEGLINMGIKPPRTSDADFEKIKSQRRAELQAWSEQANRKRAAQIETYFAVHPQLTEEMRDAIRKKWFAHGMSREDVEFSMGRPERKVQAGGTGPEWETWYYHTLSLDFAEGKVTRWVIFSGR